MRLPCCIGMLAALATAQGDELLNLETVQRAAIDRVAPSVVIVETFGGARRSLAGGGMPEQPNTDEPEEDKPAEKEKGLGPLVQPGFLQAQGATTGVVLTSDGWILVSRFALNFDPTTVLVTLPDGRSFQARRAGEDTGRGLALVKIEADDLPVPDFALPSEVRVGQWAFVLGRTFGRESPSVHLGIVSAIGRQFGRAVQTDAYTSPANYGGPLIDVTGRVIGISVPLSRAGRDAGAEFYDSGIGFAATVADIMPRLERMKRGEHIHRAWLGVWVEQRWLGPGALLRDVHGEGPAAELLDAGDLVLAVDGEAVRNGFHLQNLIQGKDGGTAVRLAVQRDGRRTEMTVTLADLPEAERAAQRPEDEAGQLPWEEGDKPAEGR